MTERAEGFWWVRVDGDRWRVGEIDENDAIEHEIQVGASVVRQERVTEWGPYLGKVPGDDQRIHDAEHARMRAEQQVMLERLGVDGPDSL